MELAREDVGVTACFFAAMVIKIIVLIISIIISIMGQSHLRSVCSTSIKQSAQWFIPSGQ